MKSILNIAPRRLILSIIFYISLSVLAVYMVRHASQSKYQTDARVYYLAGQLLAQGNINKIYRFEYQNEIHQKLVESKQATIYFINLPAIAVLFAPLTFLDFEKFYIILILLDTLLIGVTVWFFCKKLNLPATATGALTLYIPVASAIFHSQITVLLLFLYAFALINYKKPFISGLFVGALFLKPQHLLFAPLFFFTFKSWKAKRELILGSLLSLLILFVINILIYGPSVYLDYFNFMQSRNIILVKSETYEGYNIYSTTSFLDPILGYGKTSLIILIVQLALYLLALVLINKNSSFDENTMWYKSASASVILSLALNVHTKYTDLLILVLPIVLLLNFTDLKKNKDTLAKLFKQLFVPAIILTVPIACFLTRYVLGFFLLLCCGFGLLMQKPVKLNKENNVYK